MEVSWSLHAPASVRRDEGALCVHRVGAWMRPNSGLDSFQERNFLTLLESNHCFSVVRPVTNRWIDLTFPAAVTVSFSSRNALLFMIILGSEKSEMSLC